jgi:hypothetical protein
MLFQAQILDSLTQSCNRGPLQQWSRLPYDLSEITSKFQVLDPEFDALLAWSVSRADDCNFLAQNQVTLTRLLALFKTLVVRIPCIVAENGQYRNIAIGNWYLRSSI